MRFVIRRSLPSIGGLVAVLLAVGFAFVAALDAPVWFPMAFALGVLAVQYVVNPWVIQWLVPAAVVDRQESGYATDHPVGEIVARRCAQAGVRPVRLGIVDDGAPNAFTFGRTPRSARLWLTRGLLERLDDRELDAVVAHEVGHVKHWDVAIMTVAAAVPMALYLCYVVVRGWGRIEAKAVAAGAYLAYLVAHVSLLALSRARELAADHWSCTATGDGDALASALVKIAYGMGHADAERERRIAALRVQGRLGRRQANRLERRWQRAQSLRAMGIFEARQADAVIAAIGAGLDPQRAVAALRWDLVNPWARALEKLGTHPLVSRRIAALEASGLPGAPENWGLLATGAATSAEAETVAEIRRRFPAELALAVAPWVVIAGVVLLGWFTGSSVGLGAALIAAGLLFVLKQALRYPRDVRHVPEVAGLLARLDAGPVSGLAVEVHGTIVGRAAPGHLLSPDLVLQDASGFVPLLYRQPLPLARGWFGLLRADRWLGRTVVATGWYRRRPGPVVELRDVRADDGERAYAWEWAARQAGSWVLVVVGTFAMLVGATA